MCGGKSKQSVRSRSKSFREEFPPGAPHEGAPERAGTRRPTKKASPHDARCPSIPCTMNDSFNCSRQLLALAAALLCACATPSTAPHFTESEEQHDAATCENPSRDQCIVLACEDDVCGIFICEDVDLEAVSRAYSEVEHSLQLVRGYRPLFRSPGAHRSWRRAGIRADARPLMTFHFRYRNGFLPAFPRLEGKLIKHHLFPQAREFMDWFRDSGINPHDWTMVIPEHHHLRIHRGARGGLWNEAWRQFRIESEGRRVTREEMLRKAFELAFRFDIVGPLVPYGHPVVPVGPQLLAP